MSKIINTYSGPHFVAIELAADPKMVNGRPSFYVADTGMAPGQYDAPVPLDYERDNDEDGCFHVVARQVEIDKIKRAAHGPARIDGGRVFHVARAA